MQKEKLPESIRFYRTYTAYPNVGDIFGVLDVDLGLMTRTEVSGWVEDLRNLMDKFIEDTNYPPIYPYTVITDYYKELALTFAKWIYENYDIGEVE